MGTEARPRPAHSGLWDPGLWTRVAAGKAQDCGPQPGPGAVERADSRLLEAPARPSALPAPRLYGGPKGPPG